jgi:hypothetical protein
LEATSSWTSDPQFFIQDSNTWKKTLYTLFNRVKKFIKNQIHKKTHFS